MAAKQRSRGPGLHAGTSHDPLSKRPRADRTRHSSPVQTSGVGLSTCSHKASPTAWAGDNSALASGVCFLHHRQAALALLDAQPNLRLKEAGFLGNVAVTPLISVPQADWLARLLARHGLPPLVQEVSQ